MREDQIKRHKVAAEKLYLISERVFNFIKNNIGIISEHDVNVFISSEFKKEGLVSDKNWPLQIVAVNENAANPHYCPLKKITKTIEKNNLILIDIWARLKEENSPFADITWMAYSGKDIPKDIQNVFDKVIKARSLALEFIEENLKKRKMPKTKKVDDIVRGYFKKCGQEKGIFHGTGHSLGFSDCHGRYFYFGKRSRATLKPNIPFTIEPGLYFKNKFGVRSEIDCYVTEDYKLKITTKVQRRIIKII